MTTVTPAHPIKPLSNPAPGSLGEPLGRRVSIFAYGLACYLLFFVTFCYAAGWLGNFLVPRSIDSLPTQPAWLAILIDSGLLLLFALQHSVMARPAFKKWWTRIIPEVAERSTYVLFSSVALIAVMFLWSPIGGVIWNVENPIGRGVLYALFAVGWGLVLYATFLINHFDLAGVRQVWLFLQDKPYTQLPFKTPVLYRIVRHPLYVGWFIGFWATPTMSAAHLLFAVLTSVYILMAIRWEERDLVDAHPEYEQYRREVPMLVPGTK